MFLRHLLRFGIILQPFYETPGEGGGGGGWPDFEVPEGVGSTADKPAGETAGQPAGQPAARAGEAAQPGQAQPAGHPAGQPGRQELPDYRQQQIRDREEQQRFDTRVSEGVKNQLKALLGPALGFGEEKPTLDPRQQRARDLLLTLMPELKDLMPLGAKAKDLLGIAEQAPQWSEQNKVYWQGVASRTLDNIYDGAAVAILGAGKTAKDLDPEMQDDLWQSFTRWVGRDQTGARVQRYEGQDATLTKEFLTAFSARYVDPVRRSAAVVVGQRGEAARRQPVQGSGGQPPLAKPPAVDNTDEEAVHGKGWAVMQQLRGA